MSEVSSDLGLALSYEVVSKLAEEAKGQPATCRMALRFIQGEDKNYMNPKASRELREGFIAGLNRLTQLFKTFADNEPMERIAVKVLSSLVVDKRRQQTEALEPARRYGFISAFEKGTAFVVESRKRPAASWRYIYIIFKLALQESCYLLTKNDKS